MPEEKTISGTVEYTSKTRGVKLEGSTEWLNPDTTIKDSLNIKKLQEYKGREVDIKVNSTGFFLGIITKGMETTKESSTVAPSDDIPKPKEPETTEVPASYFSKLLKVGAKVEKKGKLDYISWAEAWRQLKTRHPTARYTVIKHPLTQMPYFVDKQVAMVCVVVEVENLEHECWLPVMDFKNQSIPVENITSTDVNKSIMRALAKAISFHGLGLNLYCGEDIIDQE